MASLMPPAASQHRFKNRVTLLLSNARGIDVSELTTAELRLIRLFSAVLDSEYFLLSH